MMDNLNYFNNSIGNVFTTNIKDIYDQNSDFIKFKELGGICKWGTNKVSQVIKEKLLV
ncbi:MAG: hypothetical protein KAX49_12030 [Halanaerobiales bacterium]|nr:hypothetical protein [Halanaerobiales bacterium]